MSGQDAGEGLLMENQGNQLFKREVYYKYVFACPIVEGLINLVTIILIFCQYGDSSKKQSCYDEISQETIDNCKDFIRSENTEFIITAIMMTIILLASIPIHLLLHSVNRIIQHLGYLTTSSMITMASFAQFILAFLTFCIVAIIIGQVRDINWGQSDMGEIERDVEQNIEKYKELETVNQVLITLLILVSMTFVSMQLYYMIQHNLGRDSRDFLKPIKQKKTSYLGGLELKFAIEKQLTVMDILKSQQEVISKDILVLQEELQQYEIFNNNFNIQQLKSERNKELEDVEHVKLQHAQVNNQLHTQKARNTELKAEYQEYQRLIKENHAGQ